MEELDAIINESRDAREVKRALCVKMVLRGMPVSQICAMLNVSQPFVSKWRTAYEAQGATALALGYQGSQGYLTVERQEAVLHWIQAQGTLTVEALRDYLEEQYDVVYQSKQSYYELMHAAGLSYHKSEKENPRHDAEQVLEQRAVIQKSGVPLERDHAR
jgi:putative transposase